MEWDPLLREMVDPFVFQGGKGFGGKGQRGDERGGGAKEERNGRNGRSTRLKEAILSLFTYVNFTNLI
jgi:hypothetical protein